MNKIFIEVDGVIYENIVDIRVRRSMTEFCGAFTMSATNESTSISELRNFPIKPKSRIRIYIDDTPVLTGYIDSITIKVSASGGYELSINGRDITQDLFDSSLQGNIEFKNSISFKKIIERVLTNLGATDIKVIDNVGNLDDFKTSELVSGSIDETAFEFLNKLAKKRQVLISTNGEGNITISRSSTDNVGGELRLTLGDNENNIIDASNPIDNTGRFNKYNIFSQDNISSGFGDFQDVVNKEASSTDEEIRATRIINIIPENSCNTKDCQNRAIWERNFRKAKSNSVSCTVKDFYADEENKKLWEVNKLVNTKIDLLGIYTDFLIKTVEFSQGNNEIITSLELVDKNAYTLESNLEKLNILQSEQKDSLF